MIKASAGGNANFELELNTLFKANVALGGGRGMRVVRSPDHLEESIAGADIRLTRQEWYDLYLAAGHKLP